ncbi:MAG: hypothetical protein HQ523_04485 [Lentisphaerae bacterium]|nr:hypothetical protein [Lentisphaerota bacterium]
MSSRKIAVLVWGGHEGHQPKQCVELFAPCLEAQGFDVEMKNSVDWYEEWYYSLD